MKLNLIYLLLLAAIFTSCKGIPSADAVAEDAISGAKEAIPTQESPLGTLPSLLQQEYKALDMVSSSFHAAANDILEKYEGKDLDKDDYENVAKINKELLNRQGEAELRVMSAFEGMLAEEASRLSGIDELPVSFISTPDGPKFTPAEVRVSEKGMYLILSLKYEEDFDGCLKVFAVNKDPKAGTEDDTVLLANKSYIHIPAGKPYMVEFEISQIPYEWIAGQPTLHLLILNRC